MVEIIYEDKNLVVCIKPINVSSQDAGSNSLPALLREQLGCDIFPIHRLDQVVTGLIVYGKNSQAASKLSSFTSDQFQKEYLAICEGTLDEKEGFLEDLLYHDKTKNKTYVVDRKRANVKPAKLAYTILEEKENKSLIKVKLFTGRTHQIRVQFASRKHPLCGDGKYGSHDNQCSCALHCYKISFQHPFKKEKLSFTSLPEKKYPFTLFEVEDHAE